MRRVLYLGLVLASACARAGENVNDALPPVDGAPAIDTASDMCASAASCQAAMNLGAVSGDTGAGTLMTSGYQSAWLSVRVTEDDHGIAGVKLTTTIRLTSPASADYNVLTYVNTGNDVVECTTPSGTPTTTGTTEQIKLKWGEGTIPNGSDDSRTVSIEVRPVSGSCSASEPWQLVVLGDT